MTTKELDKLIGYFVIEKGAHDHESTVDCDDCGSKKIAAYDRYDKLSDLLVLCDDCCEKREEV